MEVDATRASQEKHSVENSELPVSKRVRTIAGLHVCIDDSTDLPLDLPSITETCATMAVLEGEITDNIPGVYEPITVPLPDKPV